MAKFVILLGFILAAFAAPKVFSEKVETSFNSSERLEELLRANPNAVELKQTLEQDERDAFRRYKRPQYYETRSYFGKRVLGDENVVLYYDRKSFSRPHNVVLTVKYPKQGCGWKYNINYINAYILQDNEDNNCNIDGTTYLGPKFRFKCTSNNTHIYHTFFEAYGTNKKYKC